jgi:hypothetical protein
MGMSRLAALSEVPIRVIRAIRVPFQSDLIRAIRVPFRSDLIRAIRVP